MTSHFTGTTKKKQNYGVTESSVWRGASSEDCEKQTARVRRQTVPKKARSPMVDNRVRWTTSDDDEADRRRRRASKSAGWHSSSKGYDGAVRQGSFRASRGNAWERRSHCWKAAGTHGNGVPIVTVFKNAQNSSQVEKKIKTVLDSYLMPNQES